MSGLKSTQKKGEKEKKLRERMCDIAAASYTVHYTLLGRWK